MSVAADLEMPLPPVNGIRASFDASFELVCYHPQG